jgi:hypothetical protein
MRVVRECEAGRGSRQVVNAKSHGSDRRVLVCIENRAERRVEVRITGLSQLILKKVEVANVHLHQLVHVTRDGRARRGPTRDWCGWDGSGRGVGR